MKSEANVDGATQIEARSIGRTSNKFHASRDISLGIAKGDFPSLQRPSASVQSAFPALPGGHQSLTLVEPLLDGPGLTIRSATQRAFVVDFRINHRDRPPCVGHHGLTQSI